MVEVKRTASQQIDHLLWLLRTRWDELPQIAAEWDDLGPYERADFIQEWPLQDEHMARLKSHVSRGALDLEQLRRYHELERVIAENHPIIESLKNR